MAESNQDQEQIEESHGEKSTLEEASPGATAAGKSNKSKKKKKDKDKKGR